MRRTQLTAGFTAEIVARLEALRIPSTPGGRIAPLGRVLREAVEAGLPALEAARRNGTSAPLPPLVDNESRNVLVRIDGRILRVSPKHLATIDPARVQRDIYAPIQTTPATPQED
jgi:hypothetical protein